MTYVGVLYSILLYVIQAAGRHQCSYLVQLQKQEFVMQGGDKDWLRGLSYIPQKLRNLYEINKILAHRPWLLNKSHIQVSSQPQFFIGNTVSIYSNGDLGGSF